MVEGAGTVGVAAGASGRPADQVEVVRDWLRQRGVEPSEPSGRGDSARRSEERAGVRGLEGALPDEQPEDTTGIEREGSPRPDGPPGRGGRRRRGARTTDRPGGSGDRAAASDPDADPEEVARQIVLRKLSVQARTRSELERALARRDVPEDAAATVLDRMDEVGLIDDATFARDWVASRQQRRHLSRTALRRELQTKGVDREVIDDALVDVAPEDEHAAALDLARRRARVMDGLTREVAYRRLGGVLARRGFSGTVVAQVLAEVLSGHQG